MWGGVVWGVGGVLVGGWWFEVMILMVRFCTVSLFQGAELHKRSSLYTRLYDNFYIVQLSCVRKIILC